MAQQNAIITGDELQRLGSVGFIVGAVLIVGSGLLMPFASTATSNLQEMLRPLGEQQFRTQLSSLLMAIGFWAAIVGAAAVYRSIGQQGAAWARLGFYVALAGTALWTVALSLDVAVASAAHNWLSAPPGTEDAAWAVVASLSAFGKGVVPMTWIVYWLGVAFLALGMILSGVYPRSLGWVGLIISCPLIVVGIIKVFSARSTSLTLAFALLEILTAVWFLVVGIWLARKAW